MERADKMRFNNKVLSGNGRLRAGFTLVELSITMVISSILAMVVGILLVSGQRAWNKTYESSNHQIQFDAEGIMVTFGSMGRRANRTGYSLYKKRGGSYVPVTPRTPDEEVVSGDAVEFRYWDVRLDEKDSHNLMDAEKLATAYALFYLDGDQLKVDYGPYPPGAIPPEGGRRNTRGVSTILLAENVTADPNTGPFSHTTISRVGQGSVRINVTVTDPDDDNEKVTVMTSALMRNIWPR